jgi:ArsR family transcriptional regulator, arsenate/arsenite/antimonite-responsive transcriptional repressor
MDNDTAVTALLALAQPTRLSVFRKLIKVHPDEIAAGELAATLDVPHNTLSTHLAILSRAGLIASRRESRMVYYGADVDGFRAIIAFLMRDCCNGRAEICAPLVAELSCCMPFRKREKTRV